MSVACTQEAFDSLRSSFTHLLEYSRFKVFFLLYVNGGYLTCVVITSPDQFIVVSRTQLERKAVGSGGNDPVTLIFIGILDYRPALS